MDFNLFYFDSEIRTWLSYTICNRSNGELKCLTFYDCLGGNRIPSKMPKILTQTYLHVKNQKWNLKFASTGEKKIIFTCYKTLYLFSFLLFLVYLFCLWRSQSNLIYEQIWNEINKSIDIRKVNRPNESMHSILDDLRQETSAHVTIVCIGHAYGGVYE